MLAVGYHVGAVFLEAVAVEIGCAYNYRPSIILVANG